MLGGLQSLSSLTRNLTQAKSKESKPLDCQGIP